MTQSNINQHEGESDYQSGDVFDNLKKIIDVPNTYLGLIGVASITLSFIITWSTSLIASNHIDKYVLPFNIFKNISGTHFGFILIAVAVFAIIYSGWFGYSVNTILSPPTDPAADSAADSATDPIRWIRDAFDFVLKITIRLRDCTKGNCSLRVVATFLLIANAIATLVLSRQLVAYRPYIVTLIAVLIAFLILTSRPVSNYLAKYLIILIASLSLTLIYTLMTTIVFSTKGMNGFVAIGLFFISSMSLSASNVALVALYKQRTGKYKITETSFLYAAFVYLFALTASLVLIIGMFQDQSVAEVKSFWLSVMLVFSILLIPMFGMLIGLFDKRNVRISVTLFLIVLVCAILIIFAVPQQFFLTMIGYRMPFPFSLLVNGKKIECAASKDYEVPYEGKIYFSCLDKQNKPRKTIYGVIVTNYPLKLVKNGVRYVFPRAYCVYGWKFKERANSKEVVNRNELYCIERWYTNPISKNKAILRK